MLVKRAHGALRKRFRRDDFGGAAVEFAIIAPIFLGLFFSIVEAGFYFFTNSATDAAASQAARLIRTGQAQNTSISETQFKQRICDIVDALGDCADLYVDVRSFASFAALAGASTTTICDNSGTPQYQLGGPSAIQRVRVCFVYRSINPTIGGKFKFNVEGSGRNLVSTVIFCNEPFISSTGLPNGSC
ncbi:MAG: TadE/TadG family type IV pilus assembly protein [Parvularculaceae bacterium]